MSKIKYAVVVIVDDTALCFDFDTSAELQEGLDMIDEAVEDQIDFNEAFNNSQLVERIR